MSDNTFKTKTYDIKTDLLKGKSLLESIIKFAGESGLSENDRIEYSVNGQPTNASNAIKSICKTDNGGFNGTLRTQVSNAINQVIKPESKTVSIRKPGKRNSLKKTQCQFILDVESGKVTFVFENDTTDIKTTWNAKTNMFFVSPYAMSAESNRLSVFASNPIDAITNGIELNPETNQPYARGFYYDGMFSSKTNESDAIQDMMESARDSGNFDWLNKNGMQLFMGTVKPHVSSNGCKTDWIEKWFPPITVEIKPESKPAELESDIDIRLTETPNPESKPIDIESANATNVVVNRTNQSVASTVNRTSPNKTPRKPRK